MKSKQILIQGQIVSSFIRPHRPALRHPNLFGVGQFVFICRRCKKLVNYQRSGQVEHIYLNFEEVTNIWIIFYTYSKIPGYKKFCNETEIGVRKFLRYLYSMAGSGSEFGAGQDTQQDMMMANGVQVHFLLRNGRKTADFGKLTAGRVNDKTCLRLVQIRKEWHKWEVGKLCSLMCNIWLRMNMMIFYLFTF